MRGLPLAVLVAVPFALAARDELARWMATPVERPSLESAQLGPAAAEGAYHLELHVVPTLEWGGAQVSVTCRTGDRVTAEIGLWGRTGELTGRSVDVEDDRAIGVFALDERPDACEVDFLGATAPDYCIDGAGNVTEAVCDPMLVADPPARPDPI